MAGRDQERIAETLREITRGQLPLRHEILDYEIDGHFYCQVHAGRVALGKLLKDRTNDMPNL